MQPSTKKWYPPDFDHPESGRLGAIRALFAEIYPSSEYGTLASEISRYWIDKLKNVWAEKAESAKALDLDYHPDEPLSRVAQKTVIIVYADSVYEAGQPTLNTLQTFLKRYFPAVGGLHILPACEMAENRFNDGGFSQIRRDRIHPTYGCNEHFEQMMAAYFSMTDLVLNHVDIEHPMFQRFLKGDDAAGRCFFIFSEAEYQKRLKQGDFKNIFRPRPFPLFSIFRRNPSRKNADKSHAEKIADLNQAFRGRGLDPLPDEVINILYIFPKVKNDQMLLEEDYQYLHRFREFLGAIDPRCLDACFTLSISQETRTPPYIFSALIHTPDDLLTRVLPLLKISAQCAQAYAEVYAAHDTGLFGEPIRALTTFSHVQVDLNTSTLAGLQLLIDDFAWYLKMDLNMLRLDAANFAFKKWGTSCFGLPQVTKLLKVLYLSMACVAPRTIPNLEVNAPLSVILKQMADKSAPPPMMYDFHLAGMLPVVFNTRDARPLLAIARIIGQYQIPRESIRFSLDESHDGKSVNGSGGADPLLSYAQRRRLVEVVLQNGGYVKYKSTPQRCYPRDEFQKVCDEARLDFTTTGETLFSQFSAADDLLQLKDRLRDETDIAQTLKMDIEQLRQIPALQFFATKIIQGREPYELCVSTRDALYRLDDSELEVRRYLAFKTLALALMGRNIKAFYFNDLLGLANDVELVNRTGELRNIKRTKSEFHQLADILADNRRIESRIAKQLNNLIALVDADPAFQPRGEEAQLRVDPRHPEVAMVMNICETQATLVIVNTSDGEQMISLEMADWPLNREKEWVENISGRLINRERLQGGKLDYPLAPFECLWLKNEKVSSCQCLLKDDTNSY